MSKKFIAVQNIKDLNLLTSKLEIILNDIYRLISNIEAGKTTTSGVIPNVSPLQTWYDSEADQLFLRRPDGTDKLIG